jgi:peptidyl-prolyl cis-trans isomerase B (cyclophilin B)
MMRLGSLAFHGLISCLLVVVIQPLSGCSRDLHSLEISCKNSPTPCFSGIANVTFETSRGNVLLRIDGVNAPITAGNFLDLVRRGVYNNTVFHRVVKSPVPFVVQGGDPLSADPKVPVSAYGSGQFIDGKTGEARMIPLEFKVKSSTKLIYGHEISTPGSAQKPHLTHERGALAMARSAEPNSASAQFYIALEALPELDGRYAVFGRVVRGMEVVDTLQQGDKLTRASLVKN